MTGARRARLCAVLAAVLLCGGRRLDAVGHWISPTAKESGLSSTRLRQA